MYFTLRFLVIYIFARHFEKEKKENTILQFYQQHEHTEHNWKWENNKIDMKKKALVSGDYIFSTMK